LRFIEKYNHAAQHAVIHHAGGLPAFWLSALAKFVSGDENASSKTPHGAYSFPLWTHFCQAGQVFGPLNSQQHCDQPWTLPGLIKTLRTVRGKELAQNFKSKRGEFPQMTSGDPSQQTAAGTGVIRRAGKITKFANRP
jgi:hypothetical protein